MSEDSATETTCVAGEYASVPATRKCSLPLRVTAGTWGHKGGSDTTPFSGNPLVLKNVGCMNPILGVRAGDGTGCTAQGRGLLLLWPLGQSEALTH